MRLQTEIPNQIYKDLRDYCKKNDLKLNELIRFLIRTEIYTEQTFSKTFKEDQEKAMKESFGQITQAPPFPNKIT